MKMLDVGVIQLSISEWVSAPVLIRKKDGQVRWCLDYRRLNNVTRKDQVSHACTGTSCWVGSSLCVLTTIV